MAAAPKEPRGFFRRVARFVTQPATQWGDLPEPAPPTALRENEAAKSELKEMIERKRRNDFVRKRELDLLRKLRREGLSSEQLASLGRTSEIDDSDIMVEAPVRADEHVMTKIDEIEQQISAETQRDAPRLSSAIDAGTPTEPMALNTRQGAARVDTSLAVPRTVPQATRARPTAPVRASAAGASARTAGAPPSRAPAAAALQPATAGPTPTTPSGPDPFGRWSLFAQPLGLDVNEARHDPELDGAVIAFANADPASCEQALSALIAPGGNRHDQPATWRVLMDFYRAVGQQSAFDALAADFTSRFNTTAPRWLSIPQALADAQQSGNMARVHWHVPPTLDASTLMQLPARSERWSLPWVIDWRELAQIEPSALPGLSALFRRWSDRRIDMRWLGGPTLERLLERAGPHGDRNADHSSWHARLDLARMQHQPAAFDDLAIDYASTFRVALPVWERALCRVRFVEDLAASSRLDSTLAEVTTAFVDTTLASDGDQPDAAQVELAGELVGDIAALLGALDEKIDGAVRVILSCHLLVRVDFLASGDLLNWVIARHRENRRLSFVACHRLVAMFFGAMGIDEYAAVLVDDQ